MKRALLVGAAALAVVGCTSVLGPFDSPTTLDTSITATVNARLNKLDAQMHVEYTDCTAMGSGWFNCVVHFGPSSDALYIEVIDHGHAWQAVPGSNLDSFGPAGTNLHS